MKFKCKTCQTELELLSNESEVNCSRCGRKHTTSEIRASIEEQIQNRELALSDLKQQVASMQGQVTDSSGDVKKVKEWAKYLKIAVSGYVVGYVLMFVAINRSDTWVTIASLLFTISLVCIFVFLSKISHSHIAHDGFASGEENKQYTFSAQVGFWIFASFILPMFIYGIYKVLANVKALDADTHRSEKEVELSELSRRSFELQKEIESLRTELNS